MIPDLPVPVVTTLDLQLCIISKALTKDLLKQMDCLNAYTNHLDFI